ncbi:MAG: hypothetical protein KC619_34740 [Myxococcales bacterium]|nr:hypothetical protein [Myxococcales bacterium]
MRAAGGALRGAHPPDGELHIAEHGERRACVFAETPSGGFQATEILVAAPDLNLWLRCDWIADEPPLAGACETIAQTWTVPPAPE